MTATLGDICEAIVDCEHKTAPPGDGYALSVGTRAMKNGRLVTDACKPVSEATYEAWTRRMRPKPGDLILAREAPVGQVVVVPEGQRLCLGQRTVLIRPAVAEVQPRFLHYWLLGPDAQGTMAAQAAGATVAHLNVDDIRNFDVGGMPRDPHLQAFTATTLGAIDDLIENNRRRIDLLEQITKAIYREWFVHLRYPGFEYSTLVDSALVPTPQDWRVTTISEVASVNAVSRAPGRGETIRYLDISCLGDRTLSSPTAVAGENAPGRARRVVRPGDVVWSMVRPGRRAHALLVEPGDDWIASTGVAVLSSRRISTALLFEAVSAPTFSDYLVSQEGGSAYPAVKPADFGSAPFVLPPDALDRAFDDAVSPMHRLGWRLRELSERLAAVRDLLLPKLVTGQIDVSKLDLEPLVDSVA